MRKNKVIVGLGNPGKRYEKTRHNVGRLVLEAIARKEGCAFKAHSRIPGMVAVSNATFLLAPATYMNDSGRAVAQCLSFYTIAPEEMLVLTDDVALPFGSLRLRKKGSSGGHNGLKSIEAAIGTQEYPRLKIGVGAPERGDLADYVLAPFSAGENEALSRIIDEATEVASTWIEGAAPGAASPQLGEEENE